MARLNWGLPTSTSLLEINLYPLFGSPSWLTPRFSAHLSYKLGGWVNRTKGLTKNGNNQKGTQKV